MLRSTLTLWELIGTSPTAGDPALGWKVDEFTSSHGGSMEGTNAGVELFHDNQQVDKAELRGVGMAWAFNSTLYDEDGGGITPVGSSYDSLPEPGPKVTTPAPDHWLPRGIYKGTEALRAAIANPCVEDLFDVM